MTGTRRALMKFAAAAPLFAPAVGRGAATAGDPIVTASMYHLSGGFQNPHEARQHVIKAD
jgi:hypothetical protein